MTDTVSYQPIVVAYHTWPWIVVACHSFWEHFPECRLVVVDNNPGDGEPAWAPRCCQERRWIRDQKDLVVLENEDSDRTAGRGIDRAMEYCRAQDRGVLIHIEPDCLISGRRWLESLLAPCRNGAWMCGSLQRFYGPIHPTPSAWRTDVAWSTFSHSLRSEDARHPQFEELVRLPELLKWTKINEPNAFDWWSNYWDTAQRNWFYAAAHGKAVLVEQSNDFEHFWYGSRRGPDALDPRLQMYLNRIPCEA